MTLKHWLGWLLLCVGMNNSIASRKREVTHKREAQRQNAPQYDQQREERPKQAAT